MPRSSSGLGRHPFKVEITGSNPVRGTNQRLRSLAEDRQPSLFSVSNNRAAPLEFSDAGISSPASYADSLGCSVFAVAVRRRRVHLFEEGIDRAVACLRLLFQQEMAGTRDHLDAAGR